MANCPKCGKHLHIYNVSQFCPECGTNMNFYGFVDRFYREAKMSELSMANVHVKIRHIKAAYVGSKLAIARLCVCLLPAVAFLIPAGWFSFCIPFVNMRYDFSGLGIFNMFSAGGLDYIMGMMNSSFAGAEFKALLIALGAYALAALMAVLVLLMSLLCLISYKNMQKIISVVSAIGIVDALAAWILYGRFVKGLNSGLIEGGNGIGILAVIVMFAVVFIINFLLWKKGIPVEYDEGMLERTEIYKKVKKGEINIDDLPQPVIETEETRKIEEEIQKEEMKKRQKTDTEEAAVNGKN